LSCTLLPAPHDYLVEVGPQDGAEPDAGPFFNDHVPDEHRAWRDKGIGSDLGLFAVERKFATGYHLLPGKVLP